MSTEHASGTTPPEKATGPTGTEAVAAGSGTPAAPAPAYLDAPPPVLPPAPPVPAAEQTIQLGKVVPDAAPAAAPAAAAPAAPAPVAPAAPVDAPPPFQHPYGAAAEPVSPYARPDGAATAVEAALPASAAPTVTSPVLQEGQAAPGDPSAPQQPHHPFGAGQPVGGWGHPSGSAPAGGAGTGGPGTPWGAPQPGAGGPGKRKRGSLVALVAAVALVAGLAGGAIGASVTDNGRNGGGSGASHSSTTVTVGDTHKNLDRAPESVAGIAAKALPSTVTIKAEGSSESGTGTGFVFDTEGHILTNNHVVAPAANGGKLTVKFSDGSSYSASVVGRAQGYDVAVVRLDDPPTDKLNPLPLGDSDKVAIGDATIAIGAPYGLEGTVTTGIISAKDRPVASGDETGAQASYMNALQTDASINPGNSGGPLLDAGGSVIGINSAIQSNTSGNGRAGSIGLGFAIPINQAKWVAQTLIKDGTPVYAILGVLRNDNYNGDGAQISTTAVQGTPAVTPGGPADQAGLKAGDVITKLGGISIDSGPTLVSEIWTHKPGEKVEVEYKRDGKTAKTTVTLGERKGDN
ncbi:trypsin-like peptidase domain-containing protein [Kitasatospora sp. NA04385]|uniref:S1C family serine protease n=1 Tax=Kitasatospora sp. NA04385 TaxID=2742135 RepID=UPI0015904E68|nr:trypsin-like peptidase domain-containing protein [Kitasatospora sp. NA04385]QKW20497.1 trypsin-like peptidase domain-containing protein [Kitasatospora sp. NA04385]